MSRVALCVMLLACPAVVVVAGSEMPVYGAVPGGGSILLPYANGASPYTGVGRYHGRVACTAFFLETVPVHAGRTEAPAYALTSGRCAAAVGAADVVIDGAGVGQVTFHDFVDAPTAPLDVAVRRLAYATARDRDLALLELDASYHELRGRLVRPLPIATWPPATGDPLAIVGAPVLDTQASFLRLVRCRVEGIAPVLLEHVWRWRALPFTRCRDILPGAAGSPVLSMVDGAVVALVVTTRTGSDARGMCGSGHPCEPAADGPRSRSDTTYVSRLAGITACFTAHRGFDLRHPGCPLDGPGPAAPAAD
jgi:hypothetical protein